VTLAAVHCPLRWHQLAEIARKLQYQP
jgi:hypothetical protein